ncbi:DNA internalization-related competence protein ComEC/Rec2 [Allofustis seminis]|uniref:DNA internalization-related competence protein ComEC/Rec2 n=1 Tax=Allofustis seminis TaxID=166939 RepID=UPI0003757E90|nr:DNA internalization-related competence protein ComEC/Rec2 [Allofustis seminis]
MLESAIYIALFCFLLVCSVVSSYPIFFLFLLCLWTIRLWKINVPGLLSTLAVVALIFGARLWHFTSYTSQFTGNETQWVGTVEMDTLKIDGDFLKATILDESGEKLLVFYYLKSKDEKIAWQQLKTKPTVQMAGTMERPQNGGNFFSFDYVRYLNQKHIFWQAHADQLQIVGESFDLWTFLRYKVKKHIQKFPAVLQNYLSAFILGEYEFEQDILFAYKTLGMMHLLSVSGLHFSFCQKAIKRILLRLSLTHETVDNVLIGFFIGYGFLTCWTTSVFRAGCQFLFKTIGKKTNTSLTTLDAWALTFILFLFLFPYRIYSVGFQLSFSLSFVLIIAGRVQWLKKLPLYQQTIVATICCGICSIPILSYHFFEFSYFTLIASFIFVPFFSWILFPLLILLFLTSFVVPLSYHPLFYFLKYVIAMYNKLLVSVSTWNLFTIVTGRLPFIFYCMLALLVVYYFFCLEKRRFPHGVTLILFVFLLLFHRWNPIGIVGMIDVGQGDSLFIKEPFQRSVVLIDTGGRIAFPKEPWQIRKHQAALSDKTVIPALKAQGIKRIDHILLTHPDIDHVGELDNIANHFSLKMIYTTHSSLQHEHFYRTLRNIKFETLHFMHVGKKLMLGETDLLVVHPDEAFVAEDANENSIVLYGTIGGKNWLLTGDAGIESEKRWLSTYPHLIVDILKVGHHGSKYSTSDALLTQANPKVAFISVGSNNHYQHPTAEVLEKLNERDIVIYRTDEQGAVYFYYLKVPFANESWNQIKYKVSE